MTNIDQELRQIADDLARIVVENYQGDEPLSLEAVVKQFESPALTQALAQLVQLGEITKVANSALSSQEKQILRAFVDAAGKPRSAASGLLGMLASKPK